MQRTLPGLWFCGLFGLLAVPAESQTFITALPTPVAGGDTAPGDDDRPGSSMTLQQLQQSPQKIRREQEPATILVQPAAEPTPALKLRLYPARWNLKPGSALLHYSRAQMLFSQLPEEKRNRWQSPEWTEGSGNGPSPTADELKATVDSLRYVFEELHALAQSEDFSWDHRLRDVRGPSVYMYLLPDVQQSRALARMLLLKIRHQLLQKDFEGVVSSISDGIRLAEFVGQGETLIQKLVGIAIASMMRDSIQQAITTTGCPNLYWALATIPQPLIDVSDSVLWELNNVANVLPVLTDAESETWTEAEAAGKWSSTLDDLGVLSGNGVIGDSDVRIILAVASVTLADQARQRLHAAGFTEQKLATMPALQIVLVDAARELRRVGDDLGKAHLLPPTLARPLFEREDQKFQKWVTKNRPSSIASVIGGLLYPAVTQASEAETRLVMTYHRLMTLEALRMHAAANGGQLPASLDQLDPVPALPDPYSGQPFGYQVQSSDEHTTVTLTAAGPRAFKPQQLLRATFSK
ncbi:MAG: hypothetical protein RIK87_05050 [Fuerstiella sp.]